MNYKEAEELAMKSRWRVGKCYTENCWCSTIYPEQDIVYDEFEEFYIVGSGAIHSELAKHIVELHNKSIEESIVQKVYLPWDKS